MLAEVAHELDKHLVLNVHGRALARALTSVRVCPFGFMCATVRACVRERVCVCTSVCDCGCACVPCACVHTRGCSGPFFCFLTVSGRFTSYVANSALICSSCP